MPSRGVLLLTLSLLLVRPAASGGVAGARFAELGLPAALSRTRLESLLQSFVDRSYSKGFRHLGDERDFDHGHLLFDLDGKPLAILYHTQELAQSQPRGGEFAYVNPAARNWIQWLDDGRVENAARYKRRDYPRTAAWNWFRAAELPGLEEHHTILDKMLDPALLSVDVAKTRQLVFTRVPCGGAVPFAEPDGLRVLLPTHEAVCLALSAS
jgi:hypothetical protein